MVFPSSHFTGNRLGKKKTALNIEIHDLPEVFHGVIEEITKQGNTRVGDKDIYCSEAGNRFPGEPGDKSRVRSIPGHRHAASGSPLIDDSGCFFGQGGINIIKYYVGSLQRKQPAGLKADPLTCAGDDSSFS